LWKYQLLSENLKERLHVFWGGDAPEQHYARARFKSTVKYPRVANERLAV
jgi:hypothetical protein